MNKCFNNILSKVDKDFLVNIRGSKDIAISNLVYDSRLANKNSLFFALPGFHVDGESFIQSAIKNGSICIVHTNDLRTYEPGVTYIQVRRIRIFMSHFSSMFYDEPSKKLKIIGVTGTDGKSSVCFYTYTLLKNKGFKVGLLSSVFIDKGSGMLMRSPYRQSTPESVEIHFLLHKMVEKGMEYAIIESTSHGLDLKTARLIDVKYAVVVMTNMTCDEHVEFHRTFENYLDVKMNLFRLADKNSGFGIINYDSKWSGNFLGVIKKAYTYGIKNTNVDLYASDISENVDNIEFIMNYKREKYKAKINLLGTFNIENILAATLVVLKTTNLLLNEIISGYENIVNLEGRMNRIELGQDFSVIVDFAHTPEAFSRVLPICKKLAKNRLIVVFGSAGDRTISKRALQGEIADNFADIIILCDEDPRNEDSLIIIKDIAQGIKNKKLGDDLIFIPDRQQAIERAVALARVGDLVLTLGKGHESSIIYKSGYLKWDEKEVIKTAIVNSKRIEY